MFSALKTVFGNARLQEVWHFRCEQKIFGHPKFLWQLKKIIKFWGIRHLESSLKFFWGSSPDQHVTPLSYTLATCLVIRPQPQSCDPIMLCGALCHPRVQVH